MRFLPKSSMLVEIEKENFKQLSEETKKLEFQRMDQRI
ncbi:hypothetical protein LEP1GSC036_2541 [Leptospira weilii str. 2006001853]|uniref:Uncharacterized protein n=1 Tax=Leptospira weilii str. 2006001853 TaxID=1001589 RepID=A0A828YWG5_9LEPT|nr:hypothetical protein LEP1GSC036_2541 [Leptospira weilii str. 2006001853]EMN42689.1 hypothetical protein LEP1GSC086_1130 [Leptospira weilii str. LNT 1234]